MARRFIHEHATIKNAKFIPSSEALVRKDGKYLYWPDFKHEALFDLKTVRTETENLAAVPTQARALSELRIRFAGLKAAAQWTPGCDSTPLVAPPPLEVIRAELRQKFGDHKDTPVFEITFLFKDIESARCP